MLINVMLIKKHVRWLIYWLKQLAIYRTNKASSFLEVVLSTEVVLLSTERINFSSIFNRIERDCHLLKG